MTAFATDGLARDILETVGLPIVGLDGALRVQFANRSFLDHFKITRDEAVGRLIYDLGNGQWNIPELRRLLGEILPHDGSFEDFRVEHTFETIGRRVMRLNARRIRRGNADDAILLAIADDTERERLLCEIEGRAEFADKLLDSVREALLILDCGLRVHSANQPFYDLFRVDRSRTEGRLVYELGNGQWNIPALRSLLEDILPQQESFDDYEVHHTFETIGTRLMLLNARRLDHLDLIVLAIRDITEQQRDQQARADRERRQSFQLRLFDALRSLGDPKAITSEAARILGEELGASRTCYYEIDGEDYVVLADYAQGLPPFERRSPVEAFGKAALQRQLRGEPIVVLDVTRIHEPVEARRFADIRVGGYIGVPLVKNGRFIAGIAVNSTTPRDWTPLEVDLTREVAEQTWAAVERARAEAALRESEQLLRQSMEAADAGSWTVNITTGEFIASNRALEMHGLPAGTRMNHERALACIHPEDQPKVQNAIQQAVEAGTPFRIEVRSPQPDGSTRWIASYAERHFHGDQPILVGLVHDVSDRRRHEEQIQLLMREVNHRSKNMLSLVQAIAHRTASTNADDFLERFDQRIHSLAAAQDLLVRSEWKAVALSDLVRSQLEHFSDLIGDRIRLAGPDVRLTARATQAVGMALHELAANAAKYGALSNNSGRIHLHWELKWEGNDGAPSFMMEWRETGGPRVSAPSRRGFGSSVIVAMVEVTIPGSTVELDYAPEGLKWRLNCEGRTIVEGGEPAIRVVRDRSPDRHSSGGRRVLVVEDEALLAAHLASLLDQAGLEVVGPVGSVAGAMSLIEEHGCDAAVLDVNLQDETSEGVAEELAARGTPFVAVTGYSLSQLPETFRSAPLFTKPLRQSALIAELRRFLDGEAASC